MANQWFCKIMGDEQGPMTAAELLALARGGRLTIDDLVRNHADSAWVRAENVVGLFDHPTLPVVVKESIAVIDDFASIAATWQTTVGMPWANGQNCSIEVQTQSRSVASRSAVTSTMYGERQAAGRARSSVVVPRRTLRIGTGATAKAVAENFAHQTTQAAGCNSLADTVASVNGGCEAEPLAEHCV
jgi:GYF domain 2